MQGVIACETLYDEVERLAPDAAVRYLPHDLHEFPVNVGDDRKTAEYVTDAIDDLEAAGVDSIVIAFAGVTGLDGVSSEGVPLVVSLADDCVSTFRYQEQNVETGETKEPGIYYLTRGLIDRGVDGYKLAMAYRDEVEPLTSEFDAAAASHPDLRVDWQESTLFGRAVSQGGGMSPEAVDRFFGDILGFYHTIELVDTGSLYDVHHWYAEAMAVYITRVSDGSTGPGGTADAKGVTVRTTQGDLSLLEVLLAESGDAEVCDSQYVACFEPGEQIAGD